METVNTIAKKPKISTLDALFGLPAQPIGENGAQQVQEVALSLLHEFAEHPFRVTEDQSLLDMAQSIKAYGQLTPALVRPLEYHPGEYELVSGNRRHRACHLAWLTHMRVIVKEMTRDEAVIQMVDANLQRENILPSERAKAYKMKLKAIKRQGFRADLTSAQLVPKLQAREKVAKEAGVNRMEITRFVRLTELTPSLLSMVDDKKIALNPAVELSYLSPDQQTDLLDLMQQYDSTPSLVQAQRLKEAAKAGKLDRNGMELVLQEEKPNQKEVLKLPRERFAKYFTADMPPQVQCGHSHSRHGAGRRRHRRHGAGTAWEKAPEGIADCIGRHIML